MDLPDLFQKCSECSKRFMEKSCHGKGWFESDAHCGYEILKPAGTALRALSRAAERARAGGVRTAVATAAPATAPTSATST